MLKRLIGWFTDHSVSLLRISIGIVFLWFGLLKVFDITPVDFLVNETFPFMGDNFLLILGIWETLIGLGFIFGKFLKATLLLFWLQMGGVFMSPILKPETFFLGNPFVLTMEGEFLVKNIVLLAASLVIAKAVLEKEKPVSQNVRTIV